jgi:beta-phosphoglucomutase family hydrolase
MATDIQAIIFDMDGVIIDSEGNQSRSLEKILQEHGVEPVFNEVGVVQVVGMTAKANLSRLKEKHDLKTSVEELEKRKNELYEEMLDEGVTPMPGLFELFEYLSDKPFKKAIASSSSKRNINTVVKLLEAEAHFDAIVSGEEVERSKPAPDIFLEAARRLGVASKHCVVLEDSPVGVAAGRAADMHVIAVPNRYTKHHDFDAADRIISSLKELDMALINSL